MQLPAVNQHGGGQGGGGEGGQQNEVAADSVQSATVEQQFLKSLQAPCHRGNPSELLHGFGHDVGGYHNAADCRHQDDAAAAEDDGVFGGFGADADQKRVAECGGADGGGQQRVGNKAAVEYEGGHADFGQQVAAEQQHSGKLELVNQEIGDEFGGNQAGRGGAGEAQAGDGVGLAFQRHDVRQRYHNEKHTENQPCGDAVLYGVGFFHCAAACAQVMLFQHFLI